MSKNFFRLIKIISSENILQKNLRTSTRRKFFLETTFCVWYIFRVELAQSATTGGAVNQPPERGHKHVEDDFLRNLDSLAANKYGQLSSAKPS